MKKEIEFLKSDLREQKTKNEQLDKAKDKEIEGLKGRMADMEQELQNMKDYYKTMETVRRALENAGIL